MRQLRGLGAVVVVVGLLALPRAASAQTPPYDSAIDVQLFDYSIGPKSFFTVDSADVADKKQIAMDAVVTFMTNPFTVYNTDGQKNPTITGERTRVVESVTAAQLTAAYGITDKLQVGANLPLIFSLAGKGLNPMTGTGCSDPAAMMSCTQVTGLGDLLVEGKMRLWAQQQFRLAGIFGISLPTSVGSDGSKFIGDDLPTGRARFAATYTTGNFSVGADVGVILRKPRTVYASTVGQQLTFGIGAAVAATDKLSVIGEFYGRGGIDSGFALDDSPMEAVGGFRLQAKSAFAVTLGGGAGLDRAIGAPTSRFFLSVGYSPDIRDSDGDGIPNGNDKCPLIAEDKDGFQDDDGCPDDDNDGDGIPDKEDKCPLQAEDHDGFEDDDGCPDLDNDKDGIPDLQDRCPNDAEDGKEPNPKDGCPAGLRDSDGDGIPDSVDACPTQEEDMDGFEDGDGCPELDNDNDGIPDAADKCPLCPEDKDGFQDDDGCPDLDNDKDGIPDAQDKCPMEPETVNGIQDDDGCPDQGAETVKLDGDRLEVTKAPTLAGGKLSAAGQVIVDDMALVMLGHSEVTKWLVAVGASSQKDAQKLADAIKARLATKGIANVTAVGAQGPARVGGVVQERADADAAPVCPAGSEVKPRPEAVQPKALMPGVKPATAAPPADAKPAPSAPPATP